MPVVVAVLVLTHAFQGGFRPVRVFLYLAFSVRIGDQPTSIALLHHPVKFCAGGLKARF